ncbi:MAG: SoxR reducing system RseC family protein [Oleibacter sp.]|nr:SoxR reducing system RseC family protein [Thalassolituus sp.]
MSEAFDQLDKHADEIVEIVEVTDDGLWVEGVQATACNSCNARTGCGQRTLSSSGRLMRLWVPHKRQVSDSSDMHAASNYYVGQQVKISLPNGALAGSALMLYGLPLLGLVGGAILGNTSGSEPLSMMTGVMGLMIGFACARLVSNRSKARWLPSIEPLCSQPFAQTYEEQQSLGKNLHNSTAENPILVVRD